MSIKLRLTILSFLQFFVWGAWLITIANYWFGTKHWDGGQFGDVFATLGYSSLLMPALTGILADKWINAEKLYGVLHILGGVCLACIPMAESPDSFFWIIFAAMLCYMPTISLSNSIAYTILKNNKEDVPVSRLEELYQFVNSLTAANKQTEALRKKILSFGGAFSDLNKKEYADFVNQTKKTRTKLFDRNTDL